MHYLKYFTGYPEHIITQVTQLIENGQLRDYFAKKYPAAHQIRSEKLLYQYTDTLKSRFLKNTPRLTSVKFKKQKDLVKNALGTHTFKRTAHGKKLKANHEIAIAEQLKYAPEPLLKALVVHELAHFKEKDHNKSFYNLCCHMEPQYHQLELDMRLFLVLVERDECFYKT